MLRKNKLGEYQLSAVSPRGFFPLFKNIYLAVLGLFFKFIFLLKDNCFIEFCCFLSNLIMNQP